MFSSSGTDCDDTFCDFTRPGTSAGKCCRENQYGHCKTIHGQPANTADWTDTHSCDNSAFIRLFSSEETMSTKCTAEISKINVGGDEVLDVSQQIVKKESDGKVIQAVSSIVDSIDLESDFGALKSVALYPVKRPLEWDFTFIDRFYNIAPCFPPHSTVMLKGSIRKRLDELKL